MCACCPTQAKDTVVILVDEDFTSQRCAACWTPLIRLQKCKDVMCPNCGPLGGKGANCSDINAAINQECRVRFPAIAEKYLVADQAATKHWRRVKAEKTVSMKEWDARWRGGSAEEREKMKKEFTTGATRLRKEPPPKRPKKDRGRDGKRKLMVQLEVPDTNLPEWRDGTAKAAWQPQPPGAEETGGAEGSGGEGDARGSGSAAGAVMGAAGTGDRAQKGVARRRVGGKRKEPCGPDGSGEGAVKRREGRAGSDGDVPAQVGAQGAGEREVSPPGLSAPTVEGPKTRDVQGRQVRRSPRLSTRGVQQTMVAQAASPQRAASLRLLRK